MYRLRDTFPLTIAKFAGRMHIEVVLLTYTAASVTEFEPSVNRQLIFDPNDVPWSVILASGDTIEFSVETHTGGGR
jgi:hypothetical protein